MRNRMHPFYFKAIEVGTKFHSRKSATLIGNFTPRSLYTDLVRRVVALVRRWRCEVPLIIRGHHYEVPYEPRYELGPRCELVTIHVTCSCTLYSLIEWRMSSPRTTTTLHDPCTKITPRMPPIPSLQPEAPRLSSDTATQPYTPPQPSSITLSLYCHLTVKPRRTNKPIVKR